MLVFNETIWMGDHMYHTLINSNQLQHFGVEVNDNPTSSTPMSIITENRKFSMDLSMDGTIVYAPTFTSSDNNLKKYPHAELSSPHQWDPKKVSFPKCNNTLDESMDSYMWQLSAMQHSNTTFDDKINCIFNLDSIQYTISSLKQVIPDTVTPIKSL